MSANFIPPAGAGDYGELDALGDLAAFPGLADPVGGGLGAVRCQVCAVDIDTETGAPLGPVDESNVRAVEDYVLGSGAAEMGGAPLVDLGGFDPLAGGLPPL